MGVVAHTILIVIGTLMALASSCVCGVSISEGHGLSPMGFLLCLVGLLVFGAGRFVRSLSSKESES